MSKYERFIIYPLLIIALYYAFILNPGISARQETEYFHKIVAQEITLLSQVGEIRINDKSIMIVDYETNTFGVIFSDGIGLRGGDRGYTLSLSGYSFKNLSGIDVVETFVDDEGYGQILLFDKDGEKGISIRDSLPQSQEE